MHSENEKRPDQNGDHILRGGQEGLGVEGYLKRMNGRIVEIARYQNECDMGGVGWIMI